MGRTYSIHNREGSKRLHVLKILRRSSILPVNLIKIYSALIRSILEYGCEVWSNSLPQYHSDYLEKLQKRVMRIIFPGHPYDEALVMAVCIDNLHKDNLHKFNLIHHAQLQLIKAPTTLHEIYVLASFH
jgi:hypothetical protein